MEVIEIYVPEGEALFGARGVDGKPALLPAYYEHIASRAKRLPAGAPLVVRCQGNSTSLDAAEMTKRAREHFLLLANSEYESLKGMLRYGGLFALIGFSLLLLLVSASTALKPRLQTSFMKGLAESLSIFGTVSLWRPAEMLLYDWIPVYRKARLLRRIGETLTVTR